MTYYSQRKCFACDLNTLLFIVKIKVFYFNYHLNNEASLLRLAGFTQLTALIDLV